MNPATHARVAVLLCAGEAAWEAAALGRLSRRGSAAVLVKRCVDVADLVAAARTGAGQVALVAPGVVGLDADAVGALHQAGLGVVAVLDDDVDERGRLGRLGVTAFLPSDLEGLDAVVRAAATEPEGGRPTGEVGLATSPPVEPPTAEAAEPGRLLVVWGPAGSPGRTTLAVSVAAELGARGTDTLLVDADPVGGSVAQHLGVLDEVSGLLAASRAANAGRLDRARLAATARRVGDLRVLTGLPRADRWVEVRPAAFATLLEQATALVDRVVLDVGSSLEDEDDPFTAAPRRHGMTLDAIDTADDLVVVGAADPVGLARLVRGLTEVGVARPDLAPLVVVNRLRPSLGWSAQEVVAMVHDVHPAVRVLTVPEDRPTADRALQEGRSIVELGESPLQRAVSDLVDVLPGVPQAAPSRRGSRGAGGRFGSLRSRRAGRAR